MTCNFNSDFGSMVDTVNHMLEMQEDLKLKKGFKLRAISFVESRFPGFYELYADLDDKNQYMQLWKREGVHIIPQTGFVAVLRPGVK